MSNSYLNNPDAIISFHNALNCSRVNCCCESDKAMDGYDAPFMLIIVSSVFLFRLINKLFFCCSSCNLKKL
jgi:hypothetical protein